MQSWTVADRGGDFEKSMLQFFNLPFGAQSTMPYFPLLEIISNSGTLQREYTQVVHNERSLHGDNGCQESDCIFASYIAESTEQMNINI